MPPELLFLLYGCPDHSICASSPKRLRHGWELNHYHRDTFYTHEAEGYIDYPFYSK
ncbi:hypothetical protein FB192DRAFT_1391008 [Mucor lusitanicus]|uniref:Uncharacterized protein n=1 Tax=Mucor circinelloides f. lusitanicus TaxID=29924 RepID=A0A8H4BDZ6_MUCCL|nr:hypothetical protein FB192DRAFT_1391008 [Mucor lusitanicus]